MLPFIVLLAVPVALLGALGAQALRGLQNDVYCQIGLVMLIGLASKNAILIVEFAEQLRAPGRISVGSTVCGGMIVPTTLNLLFIPVLYVMVRSVVPGRAAPPAARRGE